MQESFKIFNWLVKPQTNELVGADHTLKLDHKVMQLLVYLAQNAGKDLSKEEILRTVWGEGVFSEEVLTVAVSSLRKALGDDSRTPKYIKTLPRFGYCMLAPPASPTTSTFFPIPTPQSKFLAVLEFLETRVGLRFLIVAGIIVLFLIVLLTRKHLH